MARDYIDTGRLVVKTTVRPEPGGQRHLCLAHQPDQPGRALAWWLNTLESPATRAALLERHRGV